MKTKYQTFPSSDGKTTIDAVVWQPDEGESTAILQIIHGMVEYKERYEPFARFLTKNGFTVVAHDHVGHGNSVKSPDDWGYMAEPDPSRTMTDDVEKWFQIVHTAHPNTPYFMLGHSMGSYVLRRYLASYRPHLAGAIVMGTGAVPDSVTGAALFMTKAVARLHNWRYRSTFIRNMTYGKPYKKFDVTGKNASNSWLTKDETIVKKYYTDPKCTYLFTLNGYKGLFDTVRFDNQKENIAKMDKDIPLLLTSGADDPVGDLGEGVKTVYQMFLDAEIKDVSLKLYENDRHEILNETDRETVYVDLLKWMKERVAN